MGMYTLIPSEEQRIKELRLDDVPNNSLIRFLGYYGVPNRSEAYGDNKRAIELLQPISRLLSANYEYRPISHTWMEPGEPLINLTLSEAIGKLDAKQQPATPAETPDPVAPEPQSGEPARKKRTDATLGA